MRVKSCLSLFLVSLFSLTNPAFAELVRFDIAGTLSIKSGLEPIPSNSPSVGSPFVGSFVFDTSAADMDSSTSFGVYHTTVPPSAISLQVGDWQWSATSQSPTTIIVENDVVSPRGGTRDGYSVGHSRLDLLMPEEPNPTLAEYWLFQWGLEGPNNIFSNADLPEQAFSLAPWTPNRWSISQWGSPPAPLFELVGTVTSFTSVVVPEPSNAVSVLTLLAALTMIVCMKRRSTCSVSR